jgi:hypothetical protein
MWSSSKLGVIEAAVLYPPAVFGNPPYKQQGLE